MQLEQPEKLVIRILSISYSRLNKYFQIWYIIMSLEKENRRRYMRENKKKLKSKIFFRRLRFFSYRQCLLLVVGCWLFDV